MTISNQELVDALSDCVGTGKAEEIVEDAARSAGIGDKREYTHEEALQIADAVTDLNDVSSFVQVSANTLQTRLRSGSVGT